MDLISNLIFKLPRKLTNNIYPPKIKVTYSSTYLPHQLNLSNMHKFIIFVYQKFAFHAKQLTPLILIFLLGSSYHIFTLSKLTHHIHLIPFNHKSESRKIRLIISCVLKFKTSRNSFRKFYLGLNHGAKQARNTRGVTMSDEERSHRYTSHGEMIERRLL